MPRHPSGSVNPHWWQTDQNQWFWLHPPDQKLECSQSLGGRAGRAPCDHLLEPLGFLGEVLGPRDGREFAQSHTAVSIKGLRKTTFNTFCLIVCLPRCPGSMPHVLITPTSARGYCTPMTVGTTVCVCVSVCVLAGGGHQLPKETKESPFLLGKDNSVDLASFYGGTPFDCGHGGLRGSLPVQPWRPARAGRHWWPQSFWPFSLASHQIADAS